MLHRVTLMAYHASKLLSHEKQTATSGHPAQTTQRLTAIQQNKATPDGANCEASYWPMMLSRILSTAMRQKYWRSQAANSPVYLPMPMRSGAKLMHRLYQAQGAGRGV
jgi:hypothetical protein